MKLRRRKKFKKIKNNRLDFSRFGLFRPFPIFWMGEILKAGKICLRPIERQFSSLVAFVFHTNNNNRHRASHLLFDLLYGIIIMKKTPFATALMRMMRYATGNVMALQAAVVHLVRRARKVTAQRQVRHFHVFILFVWILLGLICSSLSPIHWCTNEDNVRDQRVANPKW